MRCLCLETRKAARALTTLYEDCLRPVNLTSPQFGLLSLLVARPALSQAEIAKSTDLDQTTLSRNLQLLIRNKWVKRTRSSTDRRLSLYTVTTAGKELQQESLRYWNEAHNRMRKRLGADWETALALLERMTAAATA